MELSFLHTHKSNTSQHAYTQIVVDSVSDTFVREEDCQRKNMTGEVVVVVILLEQITINTTFGFTKFNPRPNLKTL